MPNIYVTDETKENLKKAAKLEDRTQDGEINFLCKQRIKELTAPSDDSTPSNEAIEHTPKEVDCQDNCQNKQDAEAAHV